MKKIFLIIFFVLLFTPSYGAFADIGPHPPLWDNPKTEEMNREMQQHTEWIKAHPVEAYFLEARSYFLDSTDKVLFAYIATSIIELLICELIILFTNYSRKILLAVLAVNIITVPVVWAVLPIVYGLITLNINPSDFKIKLYLIFYIFFEILVMMFEGWFIYFFMKYIKREIPKKFSFFLSVVINFCSGILPFLIFQSLLAVFMIEIH
jgi:hypothetical protein